MFAGVSVLVPVCVYVCVIMGLREYTGGLCIGTPAQVKSGVGRGEF